MKLKPSDPALRLLQRVRDEAHRFANRFNADLRSKKLKNPSSMIFLVWEKFGGLCYSNILDLLKKCVKLRWQNCPWSKGLEKKWPNGYSIFKIR